MLKQPQFSSQHVCSMPWPVLGGAHAHVVPLVELEGYVTGLMAGSMGSEHPTTLPRRIGQLKSTGAAGVANNGCVCEIGYLGYKCSLICLKVMCEKLLGMSFALFKVVVALRCVCDKCSLLLSLATTSVC